MENRAAGLRASDASLPPLPWLLLLGSRLQAIPHLDKQCAQQQGGPDYLDCGEGSRGRDEGFCRELAGAGGWVGYDLS